MHYILIIRNTHSTSVLLLFCSVQGTARKYGIESTPTFTFFMNRQRIKDSDVCLFVLFFFFADMLSVCNLFLK